MPPGAVQDPIEADVIVQVGSRISHIFTYSECVVDQLIHRQVVDLLAHDGHQSLGLASHGDDDSGGDDFGDDDDFHDYY